jgi:AhpD family alkylhydroperoxidase
MIGFFHYECEKCGVTAAWGVAHQLAAKRQAQHDPAEASARRAATCGLLALLAPERLARSDPMQENLYPAATSELAQRRKELAPDTHDAFQAFSRQVFADGALPQKTKQLIAVAVAHVTQCPYCIRGHARAAQRSGASDQELMEAIWVAAEMRAGGAYAHSTIALDAIHQHDE